MELQITNEDYENLECCSQTSIPLGAKDYQLSLWQAVEVFSSANEERITAYVTERTDVEEADAIVVKLERLEFEWQDDGFSALHTSNCLVAGGFLRLQVHKNYHGLWNAELQDYDTRSERNLPTKIAAQFAAEAMLMQLTHELCSLHGGIFYVP